MPPKPPLASAFSSSTDTGDLRGGGGDPLLDVVGEGLREEVVRRGVDQVAGPVTGRAEHGRARDGSLGGLALAGADTTMTRGPAPLPSPAAWRRMPVTRVRAERRALVVGVAAGVGAVGDGRQALEVGGRQGERDGALATHAAQGGPGGGAQRGVRVAGASRRAVAETGDDDRRRRDARHRHDAHDLVGLAGGLDVGEHRLQVHHGLARQVVPGREVGAVGGSHRADDEGVDGELGGGSGRQGQRGHAGRLSTAGSGWTQAVTCRP